MCVNFLQFPLTTGIIGKLQEQCQQIKKECSIEQRTHIHIQRRTFGCCKWASSTESSQFLRVYWARTEAYWTDIQSTEHTQSCEEKNEKLEKLVGRGFFHKAVKKFLNIKKREKQRIIKKTKVEKDENRENKKKKREKK